MRATRTLAVALGALALLGATGASAAHRRDRHPGHRPHANVATYSVPSRSMSRVLRTTDARPRQGQGRDQGHGQDRRFAQDPRHHALMRGS